VALTFEDLERRFKVKPGRRVRLKNHDPAWAGEGEFKELTRSELKERAKEFLETNRQALASAQERLWSTDVHSVLIVLQAMDAAGKDGTIKHVMSGVNPQGCQVVVPALPLLEVPGGVHGHAAADEHQMGALVDCSRRPQVGHPGARGRDRDRCSAG
jgi:hypothetical protein